MTHADLRRVELTAVDLLAGQNFASIYDLAHMDIRRFSLPVAAEFDSFSGFCEATGLAREQLTRDKMTEGLSIRHNGVYLILYNENSPRERLNFTLAHEVGHILLGHIGEEGAHLEREADAFAAALLCPTVAVRYLEHQNGHVLSEKELCAVFPISREAARRRAEELRRTPPTPPSNGEIALLLNLFGRFATEESAKD